jgi:formylglycine-generating enzyme required for sulfatase activity
MFIRKLLITLALLVVMPADAARLALVIGNDNYTSVSKLQKAGNDATAMARELTSAGFKVQLHRDLNYRGMVRTVETFTAGIKGGDEVVVFFAGHGVQIKNGAYLLPTDIEATTESEVEKTSYELNALTEKLSDAKAAFSLVMVDACRDNPLKARGRSVGNTRGLSAIEPPKGQMVVYSASKGQQALDRLSEKDINPNSVFTREFIARMKKPGIKIEDLVREVQDAVEALAGTVQHEQRPALYNEARGNFYFFGPTTFQTAAGKPETGDARVELQGWTAAQAGNTEAGYAAYLKEYPKGHYAAAARIAMASMGPQATAQSLVHPSTPVIATISAEPAAPRAGQVFKDCADCPEMVMVPAGSFLMGSTERVGEQPRHNVLVQGFLLSKTEVTQRQWQAVMGKNPSYYKNCGEDCPVDNVSWDDSQLFARTLSQKTGKTYRLPSEAEWEYAARAGTLTRWGFGNDAVALIHHAWFDVNSSNQTHVVGEKISNAFGLYDMHGNVWEWVQDTWHDNYQGAPVDGTAWINGGDQSRRVRRGGAWSIGSASLRSANRFHGVVDNRGGSTGLRIARSL